MIKPAFRWSALVLGGFFLLSSSLLIASPQDSQNTPDDNAITTAIQAKLFQDPSLKAQDIHVSTEGGVITLTGTVDTRDEQSAVDRIASMEPGVVKVIDSLSVSGPANSDNSSTGANVQYSEPAPGSAPPQPADRTQSFGDSAPQNQVVPSTLVLPAGTIVSVRITQALSSNINKTGDGFTATLEQPVVVNGWVVARRGQTIQGQVDTAKKGGRIKGASQLGIRLTEMTLVNGEQMPIQTRLLETSSGPSKGRDVAAVGTTTGLGAAIGATAAGGEGAAIGAGAGAVASIAGVLLTRGRPTVIPPETLMTFRLVSSVNISTAAGRSAFRPVTQQDFAQNTMQRRPDQFRMVPPRPYYAPPPYWGYYGYGWPVYYPYYWGPSFVGFYGHWGGRRFFRGRR